MMKGRAFLVLIFVLTISVLPVGAVLESAQSATASVTHTSDHQEARVNSKLAPTTPTVRKENLNKILSRREFAKADLSAITRAIDWFVGKIGDILQHLFGGSVGPIAASEGLSQFVTITAIILLLLLLAYITAKVTNYRRNARISKSESEDGIYSGPDSPKHALDEAAKLAADGDFRSALRLVYLALLLRLNERKLIKFDRTGTNWEYLAMLRKHHRVHDVLKPVTMVFDCKWYGHEQAGNNDYQAFVDAYKLVEAAEADQ